MFFFDKSTKKCNEGLGMKRSDEFEKQEDNRRFYVFFSAEEVWFWCCRCRLGEQVRLTTCGTFKEKKCETNDIYIILKRLQLKRQINERHIKILVRFGVEQAPPSVRFGATEYECFMWQQAMFFLDKELRKKGLVE